MKRSFLLIVLVTLVFSTVSAQKAKVTSDPKGKWLFEAPYAPEGFTQGSIEVAEAEKKLTASIAFTGNETKIPLENVKFVSDTLKASLYLEGETIGIVMKLDEADKMSGKAVYSQGEVPLTAVREKKK